MKIIKQGETFGPGIDPRYGPINDDWFIGIETGCPRCGTILALEETDYVRREYLFGSEYRRSTRVNFTCPTCGLPLTIKRQR